MKSIRVGCGSGYWGDALDPAVELAEKGDVSYLGFDHLAELTMALLHKMKAKDPTKGYVPDIVPWFEKLLPICQEKGIKMISNGGGANPAAAAEQVKEICEKLDIHGVKLGIVTGDDLTDKIDQMLADGVSLQNTDTGDDFATVKDKVVAAYAYMGADAIIEALEKGCDHVITGRVSDVSLYAGPILHEMGWKLDNENADKLASAVVGGHVVECGCPCTGGISNLWKTSPENWKIGFPIVEVDEKGDAVITKVEGSGGVVNNWTVKEHLVYEVIDPNNYIMPDGIADFTSVQLEEIAKDQVKITNIKGKGLPEMLKVCIGVEEGFIGEATVYFPWPDAYEKAKMAEKIMRERFKILGIEPLDMRFDYVGVNMLAGKSAPEPSGDLNEVGLRMAVRTKTYGEADAVRREATHLWTMGPIGTSVGVPSKPRKVIGLWPTLVPRKYIVPKLDIVEVE